MAPFFPPLGIEKIQLQCTHEAGFGLNTLSSSSTQHPYLENSNSGSASAHLEGSPYSFPWSCPDLSFVSHIMHNSEHIECDPFPPRDANSNLSERECFACQGHPYRQTCIEVFSTKEKIRKYCLVDTGGVFNPFCSLPGEDKLVTLCSPCRSSTKGWTAMSDIKRVGIRNVRSLTKAWKTRLLSSTSPVQRNCVVCISAPERLDSQWTLDCRNPRLRRAPTRDLTLYNLASSSEQVKDICLSEFCKRANISRSFAANLLRYPAQYYLYYYHLNHSTYSQKAAFDAGECSNVPESLRCVFSAKRWKRKLSNLKNCRCP